VSRKELAGRAAEAFARSGLLSAFERLEPDRGRVRVIAYHRIGDPGAEPDLDPGLLSATADELRSQAEMVASHYHPVSLDEVIAAHRGQRRLPRRAVLLTFDDGYEDFAEVAWPVLRQVGVPAVLFVPTAFPDRPGPGFWWDRLHAALRRTRCRDVSVGGPHRLPLADAGERRAAHRVIRQRVKSLPHAEAMAWLDDLLAGLAEVPPLHRVLGWDALRRLAREGVAVCSHGHLHALCTRLADDALAADLHTSRSEIASRLGPAAPPPVFAYPAGATDARVGRAIEAAGYELAFGGRRGISRLPLEDPFDVDRMPAHRYGTALFRAQLRPSVSGLGRLLVDR